MGAQPLPALGPAVARLLRQYPAIRLDQVRPTGKKGRVLKGDVLAAMDDGSAYADGEAGGRGTPPPLAASAAAAPPSPPPAERHAAATPPTPRPTAGRSFPAAVPAMDAATGGRRVKFDDVPLTPGRRAAAARLLAAKQDIPHQYTTVAFELDTLLALRSSLVTRGGGGGGAPLTITDFCVWASAAALSAVPEVRATWDAAAGRASPAAAADVAFAVSGPDGTVLPVVWGADRKGLAAIAAETAALTAAAEAGDLDAAAAPGGCFCVATVDAPGVGPATGILAPPHAGALSVGAGLPAARPAAAGGVRAATVATATLSTDARVVSAAAAAEFAAAFGRAMADPEGTLF